jgi:hypothetical protein
MDGGKRRRKNKLNSSVSREVDIIINDKEGAKYAKELKKYFDAINKLRMERHKPTSQEEYDNNEIYISALLDRTEHLIDKKNKGYPLRQAKLDLLEF